MEEEDYTTFSKKDLLDLKELNMKAIEHYDKILKNPDAQKKKYESYKKEIELCKKYTQEDLDKIEKELSKK